MVIQWLKWMVKILPSFLLSFYPPFFFLLDEYLLHSFAHSVFLFLFLFLILFLCLFFYIKFLFMLGPFTTHVYLFLIILMLPWIVIFYFSSWSLTLLLLDRNLYYECWFKMISKTFANFLSFSMQLIWPCSTSFS